MTHVNCKICKKEWDEKIDGIDYNIEAIDFYCEECANREEAFDQKRWL